MTHCLDAWPVVEWLRGREPAASRVDVILDERALMNWITLGEVAYVVRRERGATIADGIVNELRSVLTLDGASPDRVLQAAAIKADRSLGFADAFAAATALAHGAVLVTGDPDLIEDDPPWQVEDLRHAA